MFCVVNYIKAYTIVLEQELGKEYWISDKSDKPSHLLLRLKYPRKHLKNNIESLLVKPPAKLFKEKIISVNSFLSRILFLNNIY